MSESAVKLSDVDVARAQGLFGHDLDTLYRRVDRMFIVLLILEWIGGIAVALIISPVAWNGIESHLHVHVYAAIFLGAIIISFPILVAWLAPGSRSSRHAIAAGQLLYSSLLIHLTGGRIETHFHVFGSLAFLAMYRDWRILITASVIVGVDHLLRGIFWPYSVYQSTVISPWRWVEHVWWVLFEDGVLIYAIRQSLGEMRTIAFRQTALESAMRRAESADKAKGAFLAQMSHEIRTPMTAILGYADLMALEGEKAEPVLAIRRNGRHLLTVLDDILDLSKIEAGHLRVELVPCDVSDLLREIQQLMAPRASQRGITLSLELQNLPAAVNTDPVRLRQVVLNFVSNAIKFTSEGQVRIVAEFQTGSRDGGTLNVRVMDTGIGLTPEQQERLFQPFSQADDSHHRNYGGTGLGLVISRRLANLLGGDVTVQSKVGEGSTFCVSVPVTYVAPGVKVQKDVPPESRVSLMSSPRDPMAQCRILVVDDAADNRRLLRRLLMHAGFAVHVAEDGAHGIQAAIAAQNADRPYELILMDMLMPNVDGYEATRQLRARGQGGLIFALTAYASPADEEKCRAAGCDDYITKPFDCDDLLRRINQALQVGTPEVTPPGPSGRQPAPVRHV